MTPPDDPGAWAKFVGALVGGVSLLFGHWKWMDSRLDKKADKHTVNNALQKLEGEIAVQRSTVGKVFDQIRENEQRAEDRHRELMMELLRERK